MLFELTEWLTPARVENITIAFGGAIIGTAGGAYAGALAAERIALKRQRREQIAQEIRDVNGAIALAASVFNLAVLTKRDHIAPLVDNYKMAIAEFLAAQEAVRAGTLQPPVKLMQLNQSALEPLHAPIDRLEQTVLGSLNAKGRIPHLVLTAVRSIRTLEKTIADRNALMSDYREGRIVESEKVARIFAVRLPNGCTDAVYRDLIHNANRLVDDALYFSERLIEELVLHGQRLKATLPARHRKRLPPIQRPDFGGTRRAGLLPDKSEYSEWESSFVKPLPSARGRYTQKAVVYLKRAWRRLSVK